MNKPRYFIFENVKGLLSDDNGKTFQEWINMLGGKSVNGVPVLFPYEDSVPYHLYWQVLNAKHYGVPQNRERVFLIGIRDDSDNNFQFPREEHLTKRLKDVLEDDVEDKYFLSEQLLSYFADHKEMHKERGNGFKFEPHTNETIVSNAISTKCGSRQTDPFIQIGDYRKDEGFRWREDGNLPCLHTQLKDIDFNEKRGQSAIYIGAFRGRNPDNASDRTTGVQTEQRLEINTNGTSNTLTSVQKDNVVIEKIGYINQDTQASQVYSVNGISPTLSAGTHGYAQGYIKNYKIRRLTPRECFRLMDFPDTFTWPVSDSQAYKQAGNSIVVNVLYKIIKNLKL